MILEPEPSEVTDEVDSTGYPADGISGGDGTESEPTQGVPSRR